jgi:Fic family protein
MDKSDFLPTAPGKLINTEVMDYSDGPLFPPQKIKTYAFVPDNLPPELDWNAIKIEHFDNYSKTIAALSKLNGLHTRVGKASALLRTLWMREAKLSSKIENIDTTAEEMVLAGAGRSLGVRESGRESWNYVRALEHGVDSDLPFSTRIIRDMHSLLMDHARGQDHRPGEFRNCAVFLRSKGKGVKSARFIPMPAGDQLIEKMSDLEKFVNQSHRDIPSLFVIALTHYQFETIHPFSDGNGRIGRVLISRSLVKEKLLDNPIVYMSAYIDEHKQEYVDLLLKISQQGGQYWSDWIGLILDAIRTQSHDAIWRSEKLITLRETYHELLKKDGAPARLFHVVDELFSMPVVNVSELVDKSEVSKPTAIGDISRLEKLEILTEYTKRERDRDWVARDIINVIEQDSPDLLQNS